MLKNGIGPFAQRIHVHTVAYPGFQRGGCLRSGIRKVGGGGQSTSGSDIRKVGGGGGNSLQVRYEKWGGTSGPIYEKWGGRGRFRSDIRKAAGGQSASGPIPLFGTQKIRYR